MTGDDVTLQDVIRGLTWLADHTDDVAAAVSGKRPRWHDSGGRSSGPGSPWNMKALGVQIRLLEQSHVMHQQIGSTIGHDWLPDPAGAFDNPARFLTYCLDHVHTAELIDPGFLQLHAGWVEPARLEVAMLLGEAVEGTRLDAYCPFCLGVGPATPAGSMGTLVFRRVPRRAGLAAPAAVDDDGTEMVIVCESGTCTPFAAEVTLWVHGRPAWPWSEWDWLAARLLRPPA